MNKIPVSIVGGGKPRAIKGPDGVLFEIDHIRHCNETLKLILSSLPKTSGKIIFPMTGNHPVIPACAAALNPDAEIIVNEIDAHDYRMMQGSIGHHENITLSLGADLAEQQGEEVFVIFQIEKSGDRLLSFDILERLSEVLPEASQVMIMMSKIRQKDFTKKFKKIFTKGTIVGKTRDSSFYRAYTDKTKAKWTPRLKDVEVDAKGALFSMATRPGVFSHGRVDVGGLALYDSLELNAGESLLELGCGAGLVSLLAAIRGKNERGVFDNEIHMVDSSCRAIDCADMNIKSLEISKVTCELADKYEGSKKFDVFAGNPPYYANHRIAEYFVITAAKHLKKGGRLYLVSKHADEMEDMAEQYGFEVESFKRRGYDITVGTLVD